MAMLIFMTTVDENGYAPSFCFVSFWSIRMLAWMVPAAGEGNLLSCIDEIW